MRKIIYSLCFCCAAFPVYAQQRPNWQNLDLARDSVFGISTDRAYSELLKGKTPRPVTVAVIDGGVDTLHEDLESVLWRNPEKVAGDNGTYGWSFIGPARGNVHYDNLELTRQVRGFERGDTAKLGGSGLLAYHREKAELQQQRQVAQASLDYYLWYQRLLKTITQRMGRAALQGPALADFKAYLPRGGGEAALCKTVIAALSQKDDLAELESYILGAIAHFRASAQYQLNMAYDPRPLFVGDNYADSSERGYGSPDVTGPDAEHGTHVAGIIGAVRNNGVGMNGVADAVRILAVRAVPDGDERDKDVANAIRYAADHGAKVINMSFGKPYGSAKAAVDAAVKYAMARDVLLVQAAGNDDKDIDTAADFPNRDYLGGGQAKAYIVVGASGMRPDSTLKAPFSNYGRRAVDVFAPGVQVYSCIPGSKYAYFDGTSMAAPVVSGLAALIREYYPALSAVQVKDIILRSVVRSPWLKKYCAAGGVVNAYRALALAAKY